MKKRFYYSVSLTIILALFIFLLVPLNKKGHKSSRSDYEHFLIGLSSKLEGEIKSGNTAKPGVDMPEWAAFSEFVKTVDPQLKAVPAERRFLAYESTKTAASLKSLGTDLEWSSRIADRGGRIRTMMFNPNDPKGMGMFAGAVTGGLWYNGNPLEGHSWRIIDDFWPNLSISSLAYDPNEPNILYAGTGESQTAMIMYRESSGRGAGIYRSVDAGESWEIIPSTKNFAYVNDIVIRDEDGTSVIYAGVASGIYKGASYQSVPSDGLYRSDDGGASWEQVLPLIPGTDKPYVPSDICLSPDEARIYVGTSYGLNSNGPGNDSSGAACILFSDNGFDWNVNREYHDAITSNPTNNLPGRVMLTTDHSNADNIYAIVASGSKLGTFPAYGCAYFLKSTDRGASWTGLNFPDGFATLAWHAFALGVNPDNTDIMWLGGLDTWRSTDGGSNWEKMTDWTGMYSDGGDDYVHGDIHLFLHRQDNPDEMYVSTDGGIFVTSNSSSDGQVVFTPSNKRLNTLQFYTCAISPVNGLNHLIGGMQDNGTMNYVPGDIPDFMDRLGGGDGAYCFFDPDDPSVLITNSQYTGLNIYEMNDQMRPLRWQNNALNFGIFINPMDYDWKNNILFANGGTSGGNNANFLGMVPIASEDTDPWAVQLPTQTLVPFTNVKWFENSSVDDNILFLGTQSGKVFRIINPQAHFEVLDISREELPNAYVSCIEIGQSADTLLVTLSNYGVESVWLSVNGGENWRSIEGNLPDMPVRWGIFHPESSRHIMLATETGIWTSDNVLEDEVSWKPNSDGLANVRVDMLRIRKSDNTIVAATHGRGLFTTVWELTDLSSIEDLQYQDKISVYPNPSNGIFNVEMPLIENGQLSIRDMSGRIVFNKTLDNRYVKTQINLESEPAGIYFIQVKSEGKLLKRKILKN